MSVTTATKPGRTVGVEEEFLLVDPATGRPVPHGDAVLGKAADLPSSAPDAELHQELARTQVEAASGVCVELADLRFQLEHARRQLGAAAHSVGARLVSSGTPVLACDSTPTPANERYARMTDRFRAVVFDYQACGCHVHVGVPERELAVAVINHVRPWLPTLLALSVNSPFVNGRDTGYASWRMVQQAPLPGAGVPPAFASLADYEHQLERLVELGILVDAQMCFWLARPSRHVPTVEFRVADAALTVEEAVLQAALGRALVRTAVTELEEGREAPAVHPQLAAAAVWSAARYGMHGPAVHPVREEQLPAEAMVEELLRWVTPALEETGDLKAVRAALTALRRHGTGADRQRQAAAGGPAAVVRMLAEQTVPGPRVEARGAGT